MGMAEPFLRLNADVTERALRRYAAQVAAGEISISRFALLADREIVTGMAAAMRFANGGPLDAAQVDLLNGLIREQRGYLANFVSVIRSGEISPEALMSRAALYAGATVQAGAYGTITGGDAMARYAWVGPDGAHSCADCAERIGRSFTRDELLAIGVPGAVACLGNCRCHLEPIGVAVAA